VEATIQHEAPRTNGTALTPDRRQPCLEKLGPLALPLHDDQDKFLVLRFILETAHRYQPDYYFLYVAIPSYIRIS
jgi:hypothetical protein